MSSLELNLKFKLQSVHSCLRGGRAIATSFGPLHCHATCYGTGIESFSKLGDSIYFEQEGKDPALYIIQYISSSCNWKSGGILLNQTVVPASSWDPYLYVTFTFSPHEKTGTLSALNFRLPSWTLTDGAEGILNGETLSLPTPADLGGWTCVIVEKSFEYGVDNYDLGGSKLFER
ncbi:uncharacterized protein LOC130745980 isoform X2 [Lotus japonicus]|uniref:uncharacterized protein LOC130745980 isoform X2 n=1 Tax=Lotus japonicus TaxID=34305 RepID=UPI00258B3F2A|nr:uncharacterized protein LOC130745980 isoform X2 [Lotus japonicus]